MGEHVASQIPVLRTVEYIAMLRSFVPVRSLVLTLLLLACTGVRAQGLPACEPGAAAAAAAALLDKGDVAAGCTQAIALVAGGAVDLWAVRMRSLCAASDKDRAAAFEQVLQKVLRPALAAYGRGLLLSQQGENEQAEALLQRVVDADPQLALAWNALGAAIKNQGRSERAVPPIETALRLCPKMAMAQNNLADARLRLGVFERLRQRLEAIPRRWASLPKPQPPYSGKSAEQVLEATGEAELKEALAVVTSLRGTPTEKRDEVLTRLRGERKVSEAALWMVPMLATEQMVRNLEVAGLSLELALTWAEAQGRGDLLRVAASMTLELLLLRLRPDRLLVAADAWASLPVDASGKRGAAVLGLARAHLLFQLGRNDAALGVYRKARGLFAEIGDKLGQGNAWLGEAEVEFHLGHNDAALGAYRKARGLYKETGETLSQGNAWRGEAEVEFHRVLPASMRELTCAGR